MWTEAERIAAGRVVTAQYLKWIIGLDGDADASFSSFIKAYELQPTITSPDEMQFLTEQVLAHVVRSLFQLVDASNWEVAMGAGDD